MSHRILAWTGGAVALLVLAAGAAWVMVGRSDDSIDPKDPEQVAMGRAIYGQHCASCHGANLEGQPNWRERGPDGRLPAPPHDASGHTWHHPDHVLFDITRDGIAAHAPPGYQSDMPAFGGTLTDEQIRAVLAYLKSTWPPEIRARQAAITAQARE